MPTFLPLPGPLIERPPPFFEAGYLGQLGSIASTNTAKYSAGLAAEPSTSTYNATTLGGALNTAGYP